jgi:Concanavalin A-like lectin/glucanases superfamily/Bacterial Ig domain
MKRTNNAISWGAYLCTTLLACLIFYGWSTFNAPVANPGAVFLVAEICGNGIDGSDGLVDVFDPNCTPKGMEVIPAGASTINMGAQPLNLFTPSTLMPPPPSTVSVRISQGSDDAEEVASSGAVGLTSSDLELVTDGSVQVIGLRFQNINVPQGATITNAYIEFEADEAQSETTSLTFKGQAADNAITFTTNTYNVSSRPKTTAQVSWSNLPAWTKNSKYQSPDIKSIIQEIVGRSGWANGNSLAIIVEGSGKRVAESYNGEAPNAPLLVVTYTSGAPEDPCTCASNLLTNSGFEDNNYTGWPVSASAAITYPTGYSNCSTKALSLSRSSGTGLLDPAIWQQEDNILASKVYTLTFEAGTFTPSNLHRVYVRFYNTSGIMLSENYLDVNHDIDSDGKLEVYSFSTVSPLNSSYARVEAALDGDYLLLDNVCFINSSCSSPTFVFQNPTLLTGTSGAVGSTYNFANITPGTNAIMTIVSKSHPDIVVESLDEPAATNGGYDWAFQPIIDYNWYNNGAGFDPAGGKQVTFKFDFVDVSTGAPKYIPQVNMTAVDIDGDNADIREFMETSGFQGYDIQSPTELTLSGSLRATGSLNNWPGVSETALSTMISFSYQNVSSITMVYGGIYDGDGNVSDGSESRLNCLYFKCYDFNDPVVCPVVTVSGSTTVCSGTTATMTASTSGGSGTCGIQWQSSANNLDWTNISGATANTYTTPGLSATTYYRAVYTCTGNATCGSIYSNVQTVEVSGSCIEVCNNGIDDDDDGLIDSDDPDCCENISGNYLVTDENCGAAQGAIDLQVVGAEGPFTFQWSDLPETAMWTFENTTDDISGNNHHNNGIGGYPFYSSDAIEGNLSLYLDGSSYVRYSVDNSFMEVAFSKLSVSMWIKPSGFDDEQTLLDEGGTVNGFAIRINGDSLEFGVKNGGSLFIAGRHEFPQDGQWHHIAAVYDSGLLTLYLDGVPGSSATASFSTVNNHGSNGGFGATINGSAFGSSTDYYLGKIDDVRYYFEQALTDAQIADLANNDGDRSGLTAGVYSVTITSAYGCSDTQQITVNSTGNFSDGGTISGDESSCLSSYDPTEIVSLATPAGSAGTAEYRWEKSTDGGANWSDIAGATTENYDPAPISVPTLYRRAARLVPCTDWVYSNEVSKSFAQNFDTPGSISGDESDCGAFNPSIISSTVPPAGGNGGGTEYSWEKSTNGGAGWSLISGAAAASYDPGDITVTTQYRRGARRASCGSYLYSNTVTKTIVGNFDDPGAIVGDEDNCGSFNPGVIASVSPPDGGSGGTIEYQWQQSWDNVYWYDIAGANFETFDPSTITQTTIFRRGARRMPCAVFVYSNAVTKMVVQNFTDGGWLAGDEAQCTTFDPAIIQSDDPAGGGADGYAVYQWQQSTDGGNSWQNIAGAASATYDPGTISQTTKYRRQARRSPCSAWINSNTITKTVKGFPTALILAYPPGTNGFLCDKVEYTFEAAGAGAGAIYTWNFGIYATPASISGTGPHTIQFDVPDSVASTSVSVQLDVTIDGCTDSDSKSFSIRPEIAVTNVEITDPATCNANSGSIEVIATPPPGTEVEISIDTGATWKSAPLNFMGLVAGIYELRIRYVGSECEQIWGTAKLNEPSQPGADITISNNEICVGETFTAEAAPDIPGNPALTWNFGLDATPQTATGSGPHTVYYSYGGAKTIALTIQLNNCFGFVDTSIIIVSGYSSGGIIEGDEDLCATPVASEITSTSSPSGGYGGSLIYQWEQRQDDDAGGWTTWAEIIGATSANYTPGPLSLSTQFRRKARRTPCSDWSYSNEITKLVFGIPDAMDDYFASVCPGFMYFDDVSENDNNQFNAVYSIVTQPTNGTVDLDAYGEFIYTPNSAFCGYDYFTYQVCNNGAGCCDIATASIDLSDKEAPVLQNIPADVTVHCDDEIPLPPTVNAWENCQSVSLSMDEVATLGIDSCSVYSYQLTRIWTGVDYCGNNESDQQVITIQDVTAPDIYRVYTLPNGKKMIAGVMENVTRRWKTISFPIQFTTAPIVLGQVVSNYDGAATTYRLRNVSTTQFQVRLQEEEGADGIHSEESIAWIAIEKGSNTTGLPFETGSKLVSSSSMSISFLQNYIEPAFIGNVQTFNENNPAVLRLNSLSSTAANVFCQEETSLDPETNHGLETVSYLALGDSGDFAAQSGEAIGETGKVSVDENLLTVSLSHVYHNPVVVLGGLTMNDGQPATIRVQNVTATSFQIFIKNWDYLGASHAAEDLTYLVVEGSIPFDQTVECSAIPAAPNYGTEIYTVDNCDNSVPLTITDSPFNFNCASDTTYTRNFYARDECGNITSLTQMFILRDTTPPTFTVPADVTITCQTNRQDLGITGDVTDEADNCTIGLEATYADVLSYLDGCSGYMLRIWSLTDNCNNTTTQSQRITIFSDNDGDGDGKPDPFDLDDDNDGIPDVDETTADRDGDGIPNYLDRDCDNDGIPDIIEAGFKDDNGDGVVDSFGSADWDLDGDGLANEYDANDADTSLLASDNYDPLALEHDHDGDGITNTWDTDCDNDGIPDLVEAGGVDTNGDGVMEYPIPSDPLTMIDGDGDGFSDFYDTDNDSSFGVDQAERSLIVTYSGGYVAGMPGYFPDFDGDGVPDFLDLDSDNDGIPDLIENGGIDMDGDGRVDSLELADANSTGFHDEYEYMPLTFTDTDGATADGRPEDVNADGTAYSDDADFDGQPNRRDLDSDGDGIFDVLEAGNSTFDTDADGRIDNPGDTNEDGFCDAMAGNFFTEGEGTFPDGRPEDGPDAGTSFCLSVYANGTFGELNAEPDVDDDGDNLPNFLDADSDNDYLLDETEDKNANGITDPGETDYLDRDSDDDLIIDGIEDMDRDGYYDAGPETDPLDPDTDDDTLMDGEEDANQDGDVDEPEESDPRDPCDPFLSDNCIGVVLELKVKLNGAMMDNGGSSLMRDNLRTKGLLPETEPYTAIPYFTHFDGGGGETVDKAIFDVTGPDAIVDWVFVELHDAINPAQPVATQSALVQRDGDIVSADGLPRIRFDSVLSEYYYVIVRHRNHLGVSTEDPVLLSPTPTAIDFTNPATPAFGSSARIFLNNGDMALWAGELNGDRKVIFQGPFNDVFTMFFSVMTNAGNEQTLANFISPGYSVFDVNMDGNTIYQGPNNDRSKLLFFSIMMSPENSALLANFIVLEKLP